MRQEGVKNTKGETMLKKITKGQKGLTLIELLAVMAILGILVAIVAPAVTGTRGASVDAQVLQDATQVRQAATDYFADQNESEVRTPHSVDLTTAIGSVQVTAAEQVISSRWPEKFITTADATNFHAVYANEIPTSVSSTDGIVVDVILFTEDSVSLAGGDFLADFTAIDIDGLVSTNILGKAPAGHGLESTAATISATDHDIYNFLWLFEKTSSSTAAEAADDNREVAVFKLVKIDRVEAAYGYGAAITVELTYKRIF